MICRESLGPERNFRTISILLSGKIKIVEKHQVLALNMEERHQNELLKPGKPSIFPGDLAKSILIQQYFHTPNRVTEGLVELFKEKFEE